MSTADVWHGRQAGVSKFGEHWQLQPRSNSQLASILPRIRRPKVCDAPICLVSQTLVTSPHSTGIRAASAACLPPLHPQRVIAPGMAVVGRACGLCAGRAVGRGGRSISQNGHIIIASGPAF